MRKGTKMKADKDKNITINGVEFTPEMLGRLKAWDLSHPEDNEARMMIAKLRELQDFLCKLLWLDGLPNDDKEIKQGIAGIMCIKDQLQPFATLRT